MQMSAEELTTEIIVALDVVSPPVREWERRTTGTEDGEGKNEEYCQTSTIKGASDEVGVVLEEAWLVVAEIVLNEETSSDLAEDNASLGRSIWDITSVLDELRKVDFGQTEAFDCWDESNEDTVG